MAKDSRKGPRRAQKSPPELGPMPFDDALRVILKAPPQHKTTKVQRKKK